MDRLRSGGPDQGGDPERAEALCDRVDLLLEMGRHREALPLIRQALTLDPDSVTAHCQLARILRGLDDRGGALRAAEAAVALDPLEEWGHRMRAWALLDAGDEHTAFEAAMEAARLEPEQPGVIQCVTHCAAATGRTKLAWEWAERGRRQYPEEATSHTLLGTLALAERDWAKAEPNFRRALELNPSHSSAARSLGRCLENQGRRREAIDAFYRAAQQDPTDQSSQSHLYALIAAAAWVPRLWAIGLAFIVWLLLAVGFRLGGITAGIVGAAVGTALFVTWERWWLDSLTVPARGFYRRSQQRRLWELRRELEDFGDSAWLFSAALGRGLAWLWFCLLPILLPLAWVRLARGEWLPLPAIAVLSAVSWFRLMKQRDEETHGQSAGPVTPAPVEEALLPDQPSSAPLVPVSSLAYADATRMDASLGAPVTVAPILTEPEQMPGEFREYLLAGGARLLIRFYRNQAVAFSLCTETGVAEDSLTALRVMFGLEGGRLTTWKRTETEQVWAGVVDGVQFTRLRVGSRQPAGTATSANFTFNAGEAVVGTSRR